MIVYFAFCLLLDAVAAVCPPTEVVSPCKCNSHSNHGDVITCNDLTAAQLNDALSRISANRPTADEKHFKELEIKNDRHKPDIVIGPGIANDLTFDIINVWARKLQIHPNAFNGSTATRVKEFSLTTFTDVHPAPGYNKIFDLLNQFVNVEKISVHSPLIQKIPVEAFGSLSNLKQLYLIDSASYFPVSIGERAFRNLDSVQIIGLYSNRINLIPSEAFVFKTESQNLLELVLHENKLNASSFANGWLNNINRPVKLDLNKNKITFLDSSVFKKFIDKYDKNEIWWLGDNPLNCSDCRNAWLAKEKNRYEKKIRHAYCYSKTGRGPSVYNSKFDQCK